MSRSLSVILVVSLASGCPIQSVPCPDGTVAEPGRGCVAVDAGVPSDANDAYVPGDAFEPPADGGPVTDGGAPDAGDGALPDAPADACAAVTFYLDADGDGFGVASMTMSACAAPSGYADAPGDCDDSDDTVNPTGTERCDMARVDEDCDGTPNEGCECYVGQTRVCPGVSDVGACEPGTQRCDDSGLWIPTCEGTIGPMPERCDGMDNDCDMTTDGPSADGACPTFPNGRPVCMPAGTCGGTCNVGWANCTLGAGCETPLATTEDCTACGHTCGFSCRGRTTGCNDATSISLSQKFISAQTACTTRTDGTLVCWGDSSDGEIGSGRTVDASWPTPVVGLPSGFVLGSGAGDSFSCAVIGSSGASTSGSVWCWGDNGSGQLGNGTTTDSLSPVRVSGITDAVEVVAGLSFACARRSGGGVSCWGANSVRQLGVDDNTNRSTPVSVLGVAGAVDLDVYTNRVCAATGTTVVCWGGGFTGRVTTTLRASRVAVGLGHICAIYFEGTLDSAGQVRCWGSNASGELGDGSTTASSGVRVPTFGFSAGAEAVEIEAGNSHTCAATRDGRAFCWGANDRGQLGDGTTSSRTMPTLLSITNVTEIEAGGRSSCAITTTGTGIGTARVLQCWGENTTGELGDGTTTDRLRPTRVLAP